MKASLADQLRNLNPNIHEYGRLPLREHIYWPGFNDDKTIEMQKQWLKLNIIRKNLKILNKYITDKGETTLNAWANANNDHGISNIVLDKIGGYNNETGGISMYFLNLQHFYDTEEEIYDKIETQIAMPENMKSQFERLRKEREEKRKARGKTRKLKTKELKKDGKGYIKIELEAPKAAEKMAAADGGKEEDAPEESDKNEAADKAKQIKSKVGVWLAGSLITITIISIVASLSGKK